MCVNDGECQHNNQDIGRCGCHGERISRFIEPSLLVSLARKASYGYQLMEDLGQFGFYNTDPDPGAVYRNLRRMEAEGLVESEWDTAGSGPAKRLYRLTARGEEYLRAWVVMMRKRKEAMERFLDTYQHLSEKSKRGGEEDV